MNQDFQASEIMLRLRSGDQSALKELYEHYYAPLCTQVYRMIQDEGRTEDIVQELFIDLWKKRADLADIQHLGAYLKRAARNRTLNAIRAQKLRWDELDQTPEIADPEYGAQERLQEQELQQRIQQAIDTLPDRCRQVFVLSRWEEMSYKEIAQQLNISIKTVEKQMSKALRILRNILKSP